MNRQERLGLNDPSRRVPTRPSLIYAEGGGNRLETFDSLAELAARAVALAGDGGLRIATSCGHVSFPEHDTFPAWSLFAIRPGGGEEWIAVAAVQATPRERLEAALRQAGQRRAA